MRAEPAVTTTQRERFELIFDQVDAQKGTGRLIGNFGGSNVTVLAADEAITILEPVSTGIVQITVIYAARAGDGTFKAVHSRHTSVPGGEPLPSQYYGTCRALL
jgi:hypothetical protein